MQAAPATELSSAISPSKTLTTPDSSKAEKTVLTKVFSGTYRWANFKLLANLGKKPDQAITEYYNAFLTMCHRVCRDTNLEGKREYSFVKNELLEIPPIQVHV